MSSWEAALLGVVQGLTEFLPVSSTAHLLLARQLLGHGDQSRDAFTTAVQLGTLVAVVAYFQRDLRPMAGAVLRDMWSLKPASSPDSRLFWMMAVATIPVVACGLLFKTFIKETLYDTWVIAAAAVVFSLLLVAAEWRFKRKGGRGEAEVTWRDAVVIGVFQAFALIPGASRSGVTLTAGLFAGLSRPAAARMSFLLSLPAILGAGVKEMYDERAPLFSADGATNLVIGATAAAIVGYLSIHWLLRFLKRYSTMGFVVYRLLLAAVLFVLLGIGWLT